MSMSETVNDLVEAIKSKEKPAPYDTEATVVRVEGDVAYVHIDGGADETPATLTIGAKPGDTVQVRVGGGRAWLVGNATEPPTKDDIKVDRLTARVADVERLNAKKITADRIDVNGLKVKHLDSADGTFTGTVDASAFRASYENSVAKNELILDGNSLILKLQQKDDSATIGNLSGLRVEKYDSEGNLTARTLIQPGGIVSNNSIYSMTTGLRCFSAQKAITKTTASNNVRILTTDELSGLVGVSATGDNTVISANLISVSSGTKPVPYGVAYANNGWYLYFSSSVASGVTVTVNCIAFVIGG